jgi:hypothetical protein
VHDAKVAINSDIIIINTYLFLFFFAQMVKNEHVSRQKEHLLLVENYHLCSQIRHGRIEEWKARGEACCFFMILRKGRGCALSLPNG